MEPLRSRCDPSFSNRGKVAARGASLLVQATLRPCQLSNSECAFSQEHAIDLPTTARDQLPTARPLNQVAYEADNSTKAQLSGGIGSTEQRPACFCCMLTDCESSTQLEVPCQLRSHTSPHHKYLSSSYSFLYVRHASLKCIQGQLPRELPICVQLFQEKMSSRCGRRRKIGRTSEQLNELRGIALRC